MMPRIKKTVLALLLLAMLLVLTSCGGPEATYKSANNLLAKGKYAEAAEKYASLGSYEDASTLTMYCNACALCESNNFDTGLATFEKLGNFKDCSYRITYYKARAYEYEAGTDNWIYMLEAYDIYQQIPVFLDSAERSAALIENVYDMAIKAGESKVIPETTDNPLNALYTLSEYNYKDSVKRLTYYETFFTEQSAMDNNDALTLRYVANQYAELGDYLDCKKRAAEAQEQATNILDGKYDAAVALMNAEKYSEASNAFLALQGHKDSNEKAIEAFSKYKMPELRTATIGQYITFGTYEQDNNPRNGTEDIEWLVLAKENNRLLVISRYALDSKRYSEKGTYVTWETCTLRKWMNNDFLNAVFSSAEHALIPTVTVTADKNPSFSSHPGNDTEDKMFLLSFVEANNYFASDNTRVCKPTSYAENQGADKNYDGSCDWWLRTPGDDQKDAACVIFEGITNVYGHFVLAGNVAVRPAMWIELEP